MKPSRINLGLGTPIQDFHWGLAEGPGNQTEYRVHCLTMQEVVNIILAARDRREGGPGEYRDYRFRLLRAHVRA